MKEKLLIALFVIAVFINFLGPIVDPDFPFHLKTGEYIWQHKAIPEADPFSFYNEGIVNDRVKFTMSQYWLAQIVFFKLYDLMGPAGVVLLRATVFTAFVLLLWAMLRKRGVYSSFFIAILVVILLQASKLDRPQYFSFFFTLVLVALIERFREKPESALPLYFIPPLMCLWANMHAGFVFGISVLTLYAVSEAVKYFTVKLKVIGSPLPGNSVLILLSVLLVAVLCSYINPITNSQLIATLESHAELNWIYAGNREYLSPIEEMRVYYGASIYSVMFFVLFGFVCIVSLLNVVRTKSIDITILALIIFSGTASFNAVRYIPFFAAIALPLSRGFNFFPYTNYSEKLHKPLKRILLVVFLVFAIGVGLRDWKNVFGFGPSPLYPEAAARFLLALPAKANIFNQNNRGSYLLWRLYPAYRTFNDSRYIHAGAVKDTFIISSAMEDYGQPAYVGAVKAISAVVPEKWGKIDLLAEQTKNAKSDGEPLWKQLLDTYNIDFIVHEACSDLNKDLYPLMLRLMNDKEWVLIYIDGSTMIFVRDESKYADIIQQYRLSKEAVLDEIVLETTPIVAQGVPISTPYSSLGFALAMKGKDQEAMKMIQAALAIDKNDFIANFSIAYLALKQKAGE